MIYRCDNKLMHRTIIERVPYHLLILRGLDEATRLTVTRLQRRKRNHHFLGTRLVLHAATVHRVERH